MKSDLIEEFIDKKSLEAMQILVSTLKDDEAKDSAVQLANVFGAGEPFKKIANSEPEAEKKLIQSFHNNLILLIEKTWIEKTDEELKAQVKYHLEEFCRQLNACSYTASYAPFFSIVDDVVYLMFGNQTKTDAFDEYALRIDPEFGMFWWYMRNLPKDARWSETKNRIAILLGMYFLANY